MITKLTPEQEQKIREYRKRYFRQAVSTERADRPRAEKAALRLAEIGGVKGEVVWVASPKGSASVRPSVLDASFDFLRSSLRTLLCNFLRDALHRELHEALYDFLLNSLCMHLRAPLCDFLRGSLLGSLRESLLDSLWDTGWLCFYSFCAGNILDEVSDVAQELLTLRNEMAASCFALWIVPGKIILCERPSSVEIADGKLVGIEWKTKKKGK